MEKFDDIDIYREPFDKCPGNICDGSGWIHSGWENVVCPACEEYLLTGKYEKNIIECMDGDQLVELNKCLQRILDGEFDDVLDELEKELESEEDK